MSRAIRLAWGFIFAIVLLTCSSVPASMDHRQPAAMPLQIEQNYGKIPLSFERNDGQTNAHVKFLSRGSGYTLFLTPTEAVLALRKTDSATRMKRVVVNPKEIEGEVLRINLVGADPRPHIEGTDPLTARSNYFVSNDPKKWRTHVPTYARVKYRNVYSGIDLVYYGSNQRQLEYDFLIAPGADPSRIRLSFDGAKPLKLDERGDLIISVGARDLVEHRPVIYQEVNGRRHAITGAYVIKDERTVGFSLAAYDSHRPLVIDPTLIYSTYLGGSNEEFGNAIAVDSSGDVYIAGLAGSIDFPTTLGAFQTALAGGADAFVTKLNPSGTALIYSTYLGGSGADSASGIAVDSSGDVYVTGSATSSNFPTTLGAFQTAQAGNTNGFVTKINPSGSALIYSTYLGGSSFDFATGIALDSSGDAYIAGSAGSIDFPTTSGAFQTTLAGSGNAFVTKLNPTGTALLYSTYLGGSNGEGAYSIAVDPSGNAYVTGLSGSSNFPTTPGAFQTTLAGIVNAFVTKLNPSGSALLYSTYLGGSNRELGYSIVVDSSGDAYVAGLTRSIDFPTTPGAFQTALAGPQKGFVTKLNSSGTMLLYSTFLGGSNPNPNFPIYFEYANSIAVDSSGDAYVTGPTSSTDFPTTPDAFQTTLAGFVNAYVTELNPSGSALLHSTYLGGSGAEQKSSIAIDSSGNAYVTGGTSSSNFPTTAGAFQISNGFQGPAFGGENAFVSKIGFVTYNTPMGSNISVASTNSSTNTSTTLDFSNVLTAGNTTVTVTNTGPAQPSGFYFGSVFLDIVTTASFSGPIMICTTYDPTQFTDPTNLSLLHFENGAWVDVTTSNDFTNGKICGQVTSLSPFGVAQKLTKNACKRGGWARFTSPVFKNQGQCVSYANH